MSEQTKVFFKKHWLTICTVILIPVAIEATVIYEERGYNKAKIEYYENDNNLRTANILLQAQYDACRSTKPID